MFLMPQMERDLDGFLEVYLSGIVQLLLFRRINATAKLTNQQAYYHHECNKCKIVNDFMWEWRGCITEVIVDQLYFDNELGKM